MPHIRPRADFFSTLLGIGQSTLGNWVRVFSEEAKVAASTIWIAGRNTALMTTTNVCASTGFRCP